MSGIQPGDLDDPQLRAFTIRVAVAGGGLATMWAGWPFVVIMALLSVWSLIRYLTANLSR